MSFPADWPEEIILVCKKGNSWLKSYSVSKPDKILSKRTSVQQVHLDQRMAAMLHGVWLYNDQLPSAKPTQN